MRWLWKAVVPATILTVAIVSWAKADDSEILIGAATSFGGWMAAFDNVPDAICRDRHQ